MKKKRCNFKNLLKKQKNFPGPYTDSIYHADLNKNLKEFKKKNWKILSFGRRSYMNFLKKNYDEILKNQNVVCTSINTVFFYASFLKKNVKFLLNNKSEKIVLTSDENQNLTQKYYDNEYPGILENKLNIEELYKIAYKELGAEFIKSKEELRSFGLE